MSYLKSVVFIFAFVQLSHSDEICCPDIECITDDPPFDESEAIRLPQCFMPTFLLYRGDPNSASEIKVNEANPPEFNPRDRTIFLIHGWQSNQASEWVVNGKNALVEKESSANVITVDWSAGSSDLYYPQSAGNARLAGAYVSLIAQQLEVSYHWCIGHSLGAHTCGYAGKIQEFSRITGLDPAGPFFEDLCSSDPAVCRLNPSDAQQVDVIHSDGKDRVDKYGTMIPLGHIDFYPNDGGLQPGCRDFVKLSGNPGAAGELGCSHGRACLYFVESIMTDCFAVREKCSDHTDIPGSCYEESGPNMGYSTSSGSGLYNLDTSDEDPFCLG